MPVPISARASRLTVASLNVHWGRGRDMRPYAVTEACAILDADVIALQEVTAPRDGPSAAERIAAHLSFDARDVVLSELIDHDRGTWVASMTQSNGRWGLTVLTRLPLLREDLVLLGQAPRDPARFAQVLDLSVGDQVVRIVNTHLTHRIPSTIGQLVRLGRTARDGGSVPTVIVGDLNVPGWLAASVTGFHQAVRSPTWPARRPLVQLDHILLGRGIGVDGEGTVHRLGSDHLAVRAQLTCTGA